MAKEARAEIWLVWDSDQVITGTHSASSCTGPCVIHHPTAHWMRDCALGYDVEKSCFYRVCEHGQKHQDPDERTRWTNILAKNSGKRPGKLRETAQAKLEEWICPDCKCLCCNLVAIRT